MDSRISRRDLFKLATFLAMLPPGTARSSAIQSINSSVQSGQDIVDYLPVSLEQVPIPKKIEFMVRHKDKAPVTLRGLYWYNAKALEQGKKCPAIVEFNPYRCTDGTQYPDSKMYPWFAYNEYSCFRVDLQGSGNSEGIITDEYSEEELSYCVQAINQIAKLPICDGNVGMMGKSWSAINSLMVAARDDCPTALKAIIVCCGNDDRYSDDVHYMGGSMMFDNYAWPSYMWGWLSIPPDPAFAGDQWKELWHERIRSMTFWFDKWGAHQTRDRYWSETSVRDHYDKVKVPVYILSGWWDGYKNPVDHVLRGLAAQGKQVNALLGPWGHKYPFSGFPGPRIDWLPYIVIHWWDRWLKGKNPDPKSAWPQLAVWLDESREPPMARKPDYTESGKWVAEDHNWINRTKEKEFYLAPNNVLTPGQTSTPHVYVSDPGITLGTSMLETSSFGEADNDDLPGDQSADDARSIYFDTEPLSLDLECFGYPTVRLNLECDKPLASLAVRLCEVSPQTGKSHLVTYAFFNLCYRDDDMAHPKAMEPGLSSVSIPLNITGHIFKKGWKIRLSISPSWFPTMWQSPEISAIIIHVGPSGKLSPSALLLPERQARPEDARMKSLLPAKTTYVNPDLYMPTVKTVREATTIRTTEAVTIESRKGVQVKKAIDNGAVIYGGVLDQLLVDQKAYETYQIIEGDPLSMTGSVRFESILERGNWKARSVTETRIWSEKISSDQIFFQYEASVETFINDEPFEKRRISGDIPRMWV